MSATTANTAKTATLVDSDCDSGDRVCKPRDDDGCSADCQDESCGNGQRDPGEQCDDGNDNNGDDCVILSNTECFRARCGDGQIWSEDCTGDECEVCDDAGESDECNADCTEAECGDGKLNRSLRRSSQRLLLRLLPRHVQARAVRRREPG